jgi:hypothetical protein
VIELLLEGLGGREKVDAELDARDGVEADDDGEEETPDPLSVMRDADVARLETIQGMAESFCTWLHAKGEAQMKQDTDAAVDKVQQLSASFNKAARAVRLSMVLKHEVAGLRPLPQSRAPAAAGPANENAAPKGGNGPRRVRGDWPDNADEAQAEYEDSQKKLAAYLKKLSDALDIDIAAASPEIQAEAKRESMAVKMTSIAASIPHPALDRAISDIQMGYLWDSFAPRYATKPEALGPPDPKRLDKLDWNGAPHRARAGKAAQRG